ncbi:hypothetical protein E2C01_025214 [Portunus trituberculatus]|uniref:Uncharacterized protein n=1 Tax=Portunus trituberculatus TaxID=210409 RepID=A0A5B7EEV0_PORTR|nr:hypothetical protein [Portunus trituberculatus]
MSSETLSQPHWRTHCRLHRLPAPHVPATRPAARRPRPLATVDSRCPTCPHPHIMRITANKQHGIPLRRDVSITLSSISLHHSSVAKK